MFVENYSAIKSTLRNTDLLQHFAVESVITMIELDEISSVRNPAEKIGALLSKISGPLEAGLTSSFYKLLDIMQDHGNRTTKELANIIRHSLQDHQHGYGKYCNLIILMYVYVQVYTL